MYPMLEELHAQVGAGIVGCGHKQGSATNSSSQESAPDGRCVYKSSIMFDCYEVFASKIWPSSTKKYPKALYSKSRM